MLADGTPKLVALDRAHMKHRGFDKDTGEPILDCALLVSLLGARDGAFEGSKPSEPSELVTPSGLKPDAKVSPVITRAASQRGAAPIALPVVPGYDLVSQLGRGGFGRAAACSSGELPSQAAETTRR